MNCQQDKYRKTTETGNSWSTKTRTRKKTKDSKLVKRAKQKVLSDITKGLLIKVNSPLQHEYLKSCYCCSQIDYKDGKLITKTCKKIWCIICQYTLAAKRYKLYVNQLKELLELQFTTLTAENCTRKEIRKLIKTYKKFFHNWRQKYAIKYKTPFSGVYNFEITINAKTRLYHVHLHITHEGLYLMDNYTIKYGKKVQNQINDICLDWIDYSRKKGIKTDLKAQDARPIKYINGEPQLKETFKYQSKGINTINTKKDKNGKKTKINLILVNELDAMYQELKGIHLFQAFGKIKKGDEDITTETEKIKLPEGTYKYETKKHDWILTQYIDPITNEIYETDTPEVYIKKEIPLSGYQPGEATLLYYQSLENNKHYKPTG